MLVLVLALAGCGGEEQATPPGRERGPFGAASTAPVAPTAAAERVVPAGRRSREPDMFAHGPIAPSSGGGVTSTERVEATIELDAPAERNLGAELVTAVGSPAGCIDLATARSLHGRLTIQVSATVMPTGSITRASASGSGLPPAALDCVEARALAARLAAPIEGAPRGISGTLEYEVTATDDAVTVTTPDIPTPRGAVAPGIVTPALGPDGPIAGNVAPSSTLPATGPDGRPEGSVAPDVLLPARAD
jgi:hypothetical protein